MLIFDFDGVLMDSLDEIVVTAYNATLGRLVTSLEAIPPDVVRLFRQNRYLFQPIGDALPLMSWCLETYPEKPGTVLSRHEFETLKGKETSPADQRSAYFFETRGKLIEKDQGNFFYAQILNLKNKLREVVYQNLLPPQSSILGALILGDKKQISQEWKEKLNYPTIYQ